MNHLTTWNAEAQGDILDIERLSAVITEIDDLIHDIVTRLEALEGR